MPGFIGCNLADRFAADWHQLIVLHALVRAGAERNLGVFRAA